MRTSSEKAALPPEVLAQIAQACRSICDSAADENGFVPIRHLLARFQATLISRPLLVEGMIASQRRNGSSDHRWLVLVDSEKYQFDNRDLEREGPQNALPERLRFTVAHEMAHSLAFRVSEFGIRLPNVNTAQTSRALVDAIEKETDRLSSLLLVSQKALQRVFKGRTSPPTADELAQARRAMGISRPVLISRLRSLSSTEAEGIKNGYGLTNLAIGIAEWMEGGAARLRNWPVFANFDRNVLPEFLLKLAHQDRLPAASSFADSSLSLCGGSDNIVHLTSDAGTPNSPRAERLDLTCSVEDSRREPGSSSLYVVAKRKSAQTGLV